MARVLGLFAAVFCLADVARCDNMPAGRNLALHRPYTLRPAPRYALTADVGDATQLTDGALTTGLGTMWRHPTTVGWELLPWARVTIDLGASADLGVVTAHVGAGSASVDWPSPILVFVGNTADEQRAAGELTAPAALSGYGTAWYRSPPLGLRARFVTLMFAVPNRQYLFADEIEVLAAEQPVAASALAKAPLVADLVAYTRARAIASHVRAQIEADAATLQPLIATAPENARATFLRELSDIRSTATTAWLAPADFVAVLPLSPLHRRLFRLQAALWHALGLETTVWSLPTWDMASHLLLPPRSTQRAPSLAVEVARGNDRRSALVAIANCAASDAVADVRLEGLDGAVWSAQPVQWSGRADGPPLATALANARPANGGYSIDVASGLPQQVWLTFAAGTLPVGEHRGNVRITLAGKSFVLPLRLDVASARLDRVSLHTGGFDYVQSPLYDVGDGNRAAVVHTLRDYLVDTTWATSEILPLPSAAPAATVNLAPFDHWVNETWPHAARYAVFANVPATRQPTGDDVRRWLAAWRERAAANGLAPDALWTLLVDEPHTDVDMRRTLVWSQAIAAAGGGVHVLEDSTSVDASALAALGATVDVLVADRKFFAERGAGYRAAFSRACSGRCEPGVYDCVADAHALDPYRYYRLQAWLEFRLGGVTSLFWSFADDGGFAGWNEFWAERGPGYSPLFLSRDSARATKQLAALREGIEDYETLTELRRVAAAARDRGAPAATLAAVDALLTNQVGVLVGDDAPRAYQWNSAQDRTVADRIRHEALRLIAILSPH